MRKVACPTYALQSSVSWSVERRIGLLPAMDSYSTIVRSKEIKRGERGLRVGSASFCVGSSVDPLRPFRSRGQFPAAHELF
jgi:hypothetical protein